MDKWDVFGDFQAPHVRSHWNAICLHFEAHSQAFGMILASQCIQVLGTLECHCNLNVDDNALVKGK